MILSCRLASRRTLDLSRPLARIRIGLRRNFSSKPSAESGASSQPGFLTAERMKELQRLPTKSLPEVLRKYLPNLSATLDLDDAYKPDLTSITSVAEARVVLPLYTNQEEPNVLRMLKNATRPRSKSLLEVGFGGLARSILEEMRTIREEMDVKTMEALEDAAANNDEFILGDEGYKVPELQDSGMMLQDGTLEGSTETGALREHLLPRLDRDDGLYPLARGWISGPSTLFVDKPLGLAMSFFVPLNQGNNQQQPQQQSQNPFGGAAPTGGGLFGNSSGGQPAFGAPGTQNATSAFGTGAFGAPSTAAPPGGGLFGNAPTSNSAFGSNVLNTGTTTGAFGASAPTASGFGSSTFGSGGAFGAPRPAASSTAFGNTGFSSSFGAPSGTCNFGSSQPVTASTFGVTQSNFGASSQPTTGAFGASSQPTTGTFGAPSQSTTGAFGTQPGATNAFGAVSSQPSTGAFGTARPSATGTFGSTQSTTAGTFGGSSTQPTSLFGSQSAPTTNAPTSLFGQSVGNAPNTGVFGATAPSQRSALFTTQGAQSSHPIQSTFGGASFGSTQTPTPGFGATFSTAQPTTNAFGTSSLGTQSTVSPSFGAPVASTTTTASQPTNTFTFGSSAPQTTASNAGGSSLQQSATAPTFGITQPTTSAHQQSTTPTLTFGATSAPAKPATSAAPGFTLPLTSTQQPSSTGGFSFGTNSSTAAAPPAPTAPTNNATNAVMTAPAANPTADSKPASGSGLPSNASTGIEAPKTDSKPAFPFGTSGTTAGTAPSVPSGLSGLTTANAEQAKPTGGVTKSSDVAPLPLSTPAAKAITNLPSSVTFPSNLKNKNLEEIITSWSEELETLVNSFEKQAVEIAQWDKKIVHNGEHIVALNERVNKLETFQKEIDQSLSYVVAQQAELEGLLDGIEKELPGLAHAVTGGKQSAVDTERDRMYDTAEGVQRHVIDVANQLSKMIYEINTASAETPSALPTPTPQGSTGQPLAEIAQILNSHLDALQWIDRKVDELRLAAVSVKGQASKASSDMERLSSTSSN